MTLLDRPTTLPADARETVESRARDTERRVLDAVERVLREIPHDAMRERVYAGAFESGPPLARRATRPKLDVAFLVDVLCDVHDLSDQVRETLLELTVCVGEYFDIVDDVVDGDVDPDHESEALVLAQVLVPLAVQRLGRLAPSATAYWTTETLELLAAPFVEHRSAPTLEGYVELVETQSALYGALTGLPALVATTRGSTHEPADRESGPAERDREPPATPGPGSPTGKCERRLETPAVRRARALGERYYAYEQFLLDGEQYATDTSPWNLWALTTRDDALDRLARRRDAYLKTVEPYASPSSRVLGALVAHDLDAWIDGEALDREVA